MRAAFRCSWPPNGHPTHSPVAAVARVDVVVGARKGGGAAVEQRLVKVAAGRVEQDKEARAAYAADGHEQVGAGGSSNSSGQLGSIRSLLLVDERSEAKLVEEVRSILPENLWAPPPVAAEATGDGLFF